MIYPSERAIWLTAAGVVPAFLIALLLPGLWYLGLLWSCLLAGFALVDAAAGPDLRAAEVHLNSARRVAVGGKVPVEVHAAFGGTAPGRIEARIAHDPHLATEGPLPRRLAIGANGPALRLDFRATRRGLAVIDRVWLRWRGPFGLVWKQRVLPFDHRVAVTPDVAAARDAAIELLQRDALVGDNAQRRTGQGREFDALTDYQPGMGRRAIDWKRSARHARLLAKEFRVEHNNNIVLAIDTGRLMCEPVDGLARIDHAVTATMLMALMALHAGDLVSLFAFDARPRLASAPVRDVASFAMLQELAATIDYSTEETNFTLALTTLGGQLARRSLVVIFTDFVDTASAELMLRSTGRLTEHHLVLFVLMRDRELEGLADAAPDTLDDIGRATAAGALLREREVVIASLRRLGAHVIEAEPSTIGPRLVDHYLRIKHEDAL